MTSPLRIAIVSSSAPPHGAGGVASAHYNLFRALQRRGLEVRLFTFDDPHASQDAEIVRRGGPGWLRWLIGRLNWLIFAILQPGRQAYQTRDIFQSMWGARRMARALQDFAPDVVILSDHGAPGLALPQQTGARVILVSHHNPARFLNHPELQSMSKLDVRWALCLEQRVLDRVDAVICPSDYMHRCFEQTYHFGGPLHVIPNLLDADGVEGIAAEDPRPALGLAPDDLLIYMPAAGSRLKGAGYLPELIYCLAAETQRTLGFYIPGYVEPDVAAALLDPPANIRLHLAGQQPYEAHVAAVKACSFGISPSVMENYSMALLEAVWCGVPMLAFNTGGNSDIIHDSRNGYLIPEGEVQSFSQAALSLFDPAALGALQEQTAEYSRRELGPERALQAYLDVIQSL